MLTIKNLSHVYPNGYQALKSVDFSLKQGEVVAIIGRSGAGKSTLLRCINGLERAASGTLVVDGVDLMSAGTSEVRALQSRVGFIWQEYNLIERLSVMNNVLAGRLGRNQSRATWGFHFTQEDREIAVNALERVNMLHRAKFRADRLSGGEKQRVGIARAVAQQPSLILADEPVASLDPELAEQVMADLVRVAREAGVATLINIHDVELATQFCDRMVAIAQGTVVYDGPASGLTDEVLNRTYRFDRSPKVYGRTVMREAVAAASRLDEEAERLLREVDRKVGSNV
ncbi:MAG: phosphonates import ATP-binding protein PhnC [Chloroflexota bacterium]